MDSGQQILRWADQHGYTLAQIAEEIDYPLDLLSEALTNNLVTPRLASALRERFGLNVIPTAVSEEDPTAEGEEGPENTPRTEPGNERLEADRQEMRRLSRKWRCRYDQDP